jgi:hypothetical protein
MPKNAGEDSFDLLPLLTGGAWKTPRPPVIHHSIAGMFAIRQGKWKLVLGNGSGGRQAPRGKPFGKPYHLYDMTQDEGETRNLAPGRPEVVERLVAAFEKIRSGGRSVPAAGR